MRYNYTPKDVQRFWSKVDKSAGPDGCWNWTSTRNRGGYGVINFHQKIVLAHRVAYEWAHGKIPDGLCACHHCDNPRCCNPAHIFLGTDLDNILDKVSKGRQPRGENHGPHKLTDAQVAEIRRRYGFRGIGGESARDLAKAFGVAPSQISHIVNYKSRA